MTGIIVVAIVYFAGPPMLRAMGYLPRLEKRVKTTRWAVVAIADDRESVVIRVDQCAARYDGADVRRVGSDVRLTVFIRRETTGKVGCAIFANMPTHVVRFGFVLPPDGRILGATTRDLNG